MKKNLITLFGLLLMSFFINSSLLAQDWQPIGERGGDIELANQQIFQSYRNYAKVPSLGIVIPTIIEADFTLREMSGNSVAVYNETSKSFVPAKLIYTEEAKLIPTQALDKITNQEVGVLFDGYSQTMSSFYLNNVDSGTTSINVSFLNQIKSDSMTLVLDKHVALPYSVTLKAKIDGREVVVLNKFVPTSSKINFQETVAKDWVIVMSYSQPLRLSEIEFDNSINTSLKKSIRFLALPNNSYTVYVNQENFSGDYTNTQESSNLNSSDGLKKIGLLSTSANPAFVLSDVDDDNIPDINDNCVNLSNPDQIDINLNGRGDLCDDFDHDSVVNSIDNCNEVANSNQEDTDGDGIGNLCDADESRLTEKYPFIVWLGIGFASIVFLGLLFVAGNKIRKNNINPEPPQIS